MTRRKQHIELLTRERSRAKSSSESALRLDRNERVIPHSEEVREQLVEILSRVRFELYPDLECFYNKLSLWLGISERSIFLTEGISGAIKTLFEAFTVTGSNRVVYPAPTFALYGVYCSLFDVEPFEIGYDPRYQLRFKELLDAINEETALVFLPNPNNPIAGDLSLGKIRELAEFCTKYNTIVAIDEVFYPFGGPTALSLIEEYDNVVVMRSLSKAFGLAGIRLGYVLGNSDIIDYVSKTRAGYEANSLSLGVASFFIDNYHLVLEYVTEVRNGIDYFIKELDKRGIEHNGGSTSNSVFVNLYSSSAALAINHLLREKNIYVRGGWPEPYDGGISITGAPEKIMRRFSKEFMDTFQDITCVEKG